MKTKSIKLSGQFKKQATKAVSSIIFFSVTYLLILACGVGLTILCGYLGIMLVVSFPKIFTILLGIGLASMGILVLIFLLKFLFTSNKIDRSGLYEITEENEPALFKMIRDIVIEVETSFPKRVYLSADVNAAVFYDSSFWSMFFPVKKNLQIGLGLINCVTASELKAILAHEFGHFSQRSMKVGSYVYNVNKVIFNMLYENESYQKLITRWGSVTGYFSIFVSIAVTIIQGIQWLLRKLYAVVNKNYMALSREMEFHADEIAANVVGSEPLKTSLLRMPLADNSFNAVLSFYGKKIADNSKSKNLFEEQLFVMNFQAAYNNFKISDHLPQVTAEEFKKFNESKLVIKDQWSSHPSTEERIERLNALNIPSADLEKTPANEILSALESTQQSFTEKIFEKVNYEGAIRSYSFEDFKIEYKQEFLNNSFPKLYNGYYDNKNPTFFETTEVRALIENTGAEQLFSDENVGCVYEAITLTNDMAILKQINENAIVISTFDYDGNKYEKKESEKLLSELKLKLEDLNKQINEKDKMIFSYFKHKEQLSKQAPQLERLYREFFAFDKEYTDNYNISVQLSGDLQFVRNTTPFDQIRTNFQNMLPGEAKLKSAIKQLLASGICETEITAGIKNNLDLYLSKSWTYFADSKYNDDNLGVLFEAMNNYAMLLSRGYFLLKKNLLEYQSQIKLTTEISNTN